MLRKSIANALFASLILAALAAHPAKADAPVMLLPNGCGTGNLAAGNIPNLSVDNQGRLCIGNGGTVITGNAWAPFRIRRSRDGVLLAS
jgi:hypothetical protein